MYILITGAAGFIGSALSLRLLSQGKKVIGIDNLNPYYDVKLKKKRLNRCEKYPEFKFLQLDIVDRQALNQLFSEYSIETVIHLAAQPGVRFSVTHPEAYIDNNLVGFANVMECCRQHSIKHFIFASSSSVYGDNTKKPFSEHDPADHPLSLYGATKRANELMAHSYAHLYQLNCTGLRFFTVYGPWGRPDMAIFKFTQNILDEKTIPVYNNGRMMRDFTYIDDIVEGLVRTINITPESQNSQSPATSLAPFRIYNIGNQHPVELRYFIQLLEDSIGKVAKIEMMPMQPGDVLDTYADVSDFESTFGELPHTSIETGISHFIKWYNTYYNTHAHLTAEIF